MAPHKEPPPPAEPTAEELLAAVAAHFAGEFWVVRTVGAAGVAARVVKTLEYLRAFERTGPLVRMIVVITVDLIPFLSVFGIVIVAAALFFMINMPESEAFALLRPSSEKDTKLAQKLGQLQPFVPVFPQECMGQLVYAGPT